MGRAVKRVSLYFEGPYQVSLREEPLSEPLAGEVIVRTILSGISAGTELLLYRDQTPLDLPADAVISSLREPFSFPMKYGYAAVGEVVALGPKVELVWRNKKVFVLHPHETHFVARTDELRAIPDSVTDEDAVFFPNMETALTLLLDGWPLTGEQVVVCGQGIVGLLLTMLLARLPLSGLITLDKHRYRRLTSEQLGAHRSLDPEDPGAAAEILSSMQVWGAEPGADLAYEISGNPDALNLAVGITGYGGRVVIGSWYGRKEVTLNLGGAFHRSRIRLTSSQVSTISPELSGRWTKMRILGLAWELLREMKPSGLITHRYPLAQAMEAYRLLDEHPGEALQVVLTYAPEEG
jgi:2-desacetyl-2-hydroxyethyl bacteriochlorophyllide A dehydrogenase